MDGFEELVKTDMWKKLKLANNACFDLRVCLETNKFSSITVFEAIIKLTEAENVLRNHYKRLAEKPV